MLLILPAASPLQIHVKQCRSAGSCLHVSQPTFNDDNGYMLAALAGLRDSRTAALQLVQSSRLATGNSDLVVSFTFLFFNGWCP